MITILTKHRYYTILYVDIDITSYRYSDIHVHTKRIQL